jgi:glycine cleavage system H lipoate-binding protein
MSDSMRCCIWMSAGLVAYKLCDRDYDCESCPFDAAMRGTEATTRHSNGSETLPPPFPADRWYHPAHLWVRRAGAGRVRIGLDAFAAQLITNLDHVLLPPPGTPVRRDAPLCWIHDDGQVVPLRSPVTGRILVTHARLRHQPELLTDDPYGEGWMFEIRLREDVGGQDGALLTATVARDRAREHQSVLDDAVRSFAAAPVAGVGPTLQDGGVRLSDARSVLGPHRYYRVISAFLV